MINTPQLSMSIVTMEGEIVDVNVRLKQVVQQLFSRTTSGITSHSLAFPEAWVATPRLDNRLLV